MKDFNTCVKCGCKGTENNSISYKKYTSIINKDINCFANYICDECFSKLFKCGTVPRFIKDKHDFKESKPIYMIADEIWE